MRIALTALTRQGPQDVVVTGDDGALVCEVAAVLREAFPDFERLARVVPLPTAAGGVRPATRQGAGPAPPAVRGATLWAGGRALDPRARAAEVLRDGALVALDGQAAAATWLAEPSGLAEVRVTGGPDAGRVHRVGLGTVAVGADPDCAIRLSGPGLPAVAARLRVGDGGPAGERPAGPGDPAGQVRVEPLPSPGERWWPGEQLWLDGEPLTGPTAWPPGTPLRIGPHVLTLARPQSPDAHLSPAGDGGLAFNRPPRLGLPERPRRIEFPAEPQRGERARLQLLMALLPVAFGLIMIKVMGSWYYALFMLMAPAMIVGQWLSDRRHGRRTHARAMREYQAATARLALVVAAERAADEARRREAAPDPAAVLLTAVGPRRRLWERRGSDPDALHLRIGLADLPAAIEFVPERGAPGDAVPPPVPLARGVPVTLPLPDLGVIGVAGPDGRRRALARWLVAQAAVLHSPRDLQIVVLAAAGQDRGGGPPQSGGQDWNWVRWLPHCAPRSGENCLALVGTDPDTAAKRVAELAAEVSSRLGEDGGRFGGGRFGGGQFGGAGFGGAGFGPGPGGVAGPSVLVVLDGARALRRLPGMPGILASARQAGVFAICLDEDERLLPEECAAVVGWDEDRPGWVSVAGGGHGGAAASGDGGQAGGAFGRGGGGNLVLADQVSAAWAERVARAMAPVRDVSRDDANAALPSAVRLLDLLGLPDPSAERICAAWQRSAGTPSAVLGMGADGPFGINLRTDGPHGLIAGTTGAGKSELLQTLIASLAVANRPDAMTFVLIDYKGGAAFADCARLPHTVGMVSDLDGHLTQRALASLSAELKRREETLARASAKDIEDYTGARRSGPHLPPLPRLVLIIDEFASLAAELPDFVTGLVGVAQRGRSLGVHLILATQRPAGVVSADIRANTNLRIALRVTDAGESQDVIDARDAAFISRATPGRCFVRSGAGAPVAMQSARIGGRRPGTGPVADVARATAVPWAALGRPLPARPGAGDDPGPETDLSALVDAIAAAAARLGISRPPSPWLPPLAERLTLTDVAAETGTPAGAGQSGAGARPGPAELAPVAYGLIDVPARQSRQPLALDLAHGGHLVFAGAARTGRSTALRSIAGALAAGASPADVHLYAIDCGAGALLPLAGLPHCGAVVTRDQTDRVERLLGKLRGEIARRQQLLAAGGFAGLAEQRAAVAAPGRLPWLVLLLDWWEGYVAAYENYDYGRLIDWLLQTLREGAGAGLTAAVTTDRSALLGQPGTVFGHRLLLRLTDRADAGLAGLTERALPARQPPGRIMFDSPAGPLEAQLALLDEDPSGQAQVAALRRTGQAALDRYGQPPRHQRPWRVDPLPPRITAGQTWALEPGFAPPSPLWALAGAGGDELAPQGIDVGAEGPGVVVAGPPRSGRSSTLVTMARTLLRSGTPVIAITPRRSPLRSLAGADGAVAVLDGSAGDAELRAAIGDRERFVVIVDDAELLAGGLLSDPLEQVLRSGRDGEHGVILAGSAGDLARSYSGFIPAALKSRCGVLVAVESPGDGDLFGARLPRNAGGGPIGRGLLIRPGTLLPLQLAVSD